MTFATHAFSTQRKSSHTTYVLAAFALFIMGGVGVMLSGLDSNQPTGTTFNGFTMQNISSATGAR